MYSGVDARVFPTASAAPTEDTNYNSSTNTNADTNIVYDCEAPPLVSESCVDDRYSPSTGPAPLLYSGVAVQIVASSALFLKKVVFCMQCDYQSNHGFTAGPDGKAVRLTDIQKMELLCDNCLRNSARTVPPSGHAIVAARLLSSRMITASSDGNDAVVCCTSFMDSIVPRYLSQVAENLRSADDRGLALAVARGAVEAELDSLTTSSERCLWSGSCQELECHILNDCEFVFIKSPDHFGKYVKRSHVSVTSTSD